MSTVFETIGRAVCLIGGVALISVIGVGIGFAVYAGAKWVRIKNELTALTVWAYLVRNRRKRGFPQWTRSAVLEVIVARMGRVELRNALQDMEVRADVQGIASINIKLYNAGHDIIRAVGHTDDADLREAIEKFEAIHLEREKGAAR